MTTTPGRGPTSPGPASSSSSFPGVPPALLERWAAEQRVLAFRTSQAATLRRRRVVWVLFVLGCAAVVVVCVVALIGTGGGARTPPRPPAVSVGSTAPAP